MAEVWAFRRAVKWAYIMTWGEKGFSALFTFVLASLLGPRDFGTVSMAMIYILFIQMLLNQGLFAAIIQRKDLQPEHLDSVFWLAQFASLVLVGLSVAFSSWWAAINHLPQLARVISVLSVSVPIEALAMVQRAVLQRGMDFKSLSLRSNGSILVGGTVGLITAFAGFGVWALVCQRLAEDLSALGLLWRLSHWRPRFRFSFSHLKELLGFSSASFVGKLGTFANLQSSALLVGLFFGPVVVGLYRLAERMVGLVVDVATNSLQIVSFPEFSRLQDNPTELRQRVLSCLRLSSMVTLPALAGLASVSNAFVGTLGSRWVPGADPLKILCVLGMATALSNFTGPLLSAVSRPHVLAMVVWGFNVINIIAIVATSTLLANASTRGQVVGIAATRFATGALLFAPVLLYILLRTARISFGDLWDVTRSSILAALAVAAALLPFSLGGLQAGAKPIVLLATEVALGGWVGTMALLTFDVKLRASVLSSILAAGRQLGSEGRGGRMRALILRMEGKSVPRPDVLPPLEQGQEPITVD